MTNASENPIWAPFEAFYIESMLSLTEAALMSATLMKDLLLTLSKGPARVDTHSALNHLQNIVHQAAALSRYFWPSDESHMPRGMYLRSVLQVDDDSPLKSRSVRNQIEHFDERLDDYLKESFVGNVMPSYFGKTPPDDGVQRHIFRAYYLETGVFEILGKRIAIEPLVVEIMRIHNLLAECEENGCRFRLGTNERSSEPPAAGYGAGRADPKR